MIVENDAVEVSIAAMAARSLGLETIHVYSSVTKAQFFLAQCLSNRYSMPDVLMLDLDLGPQSSFDLIRYWRTHPMLMSVPLLVWSGLGDHYQDLCETFKVTAFVPKWKGRDVLRESLATCIKKRVPPLLVVDRPD